MISVELICGFVVVLVVLYFICKILGISYGAIVKSIPLEFKTTKGYISFISFVLLLFLAASVLSQPYVMDAVLSIVFEKYRAKTGNAIAVDFNELIWAAVVLFLGNFLIIAITENSKNKSKQ